MFWQKKIDGFQYPVSGLKIAWMEEPNFRFKVACAALMLALAWFFRISQTESLVLITTLGFLLSAEALNTALEELCDKFQPTNDPHIARVKDIAAAAVLIASLTAFVIGCIIFIPHLSLLL